MSVGDISWVSLCVLLRPGKNSFVASLRIRIASGTPAARLVLASTSICSQGSPTRGHTTLPFARAAGLITSAQPPANFGSVVYVQAPWASVLVLTHILLQPSIYIYIYRYVWRERDRGRERDRKGACCSWDGLSLHIYLPLCLTVCAYI